MGEYRTIKRIVRGMNAIDGAGVKLVRVLGHQDTDDIDPFLLLDAFDSTNPTDYIKGFPFHPHRGIETITYVISGEIEHKDSLGNKGTIKDGDLQWMSAGSGIIHQEMPQPSNHLLGAQIWLNLPRKDKMSEPSYGDINQKNVPIVYNNNNKIHVIAGEYLSTKGAFKGKYVDATYLDVELAPNQEWEFENAEDNTLFIYIFLGNGIFEKDIPTAKLINAKQAVIFNQGRKFYVKTLNESLRFILLSAKPLKEPIAWGGPIVMNTREELYKAFEELDNNTFIKHK
jgi:hypothetical protein